jgi:glycosyltransferase involved in cell wall biosynthesis
VEGPELARRAAEAFPAADFTWAGEGETRSAEAGKAPRNLAFPGHVPRERLPELYRDADVFLHPSRMEGLPKVLLEALASGLPAIAFDDYRPRFVEEGGAGFVVKDEAGMLGALRRLLEDASLRERAGLAARRVAEAFSWDAVAARWAAIFEREAALARGAT